MKTFPLEIIAGSGLGICNSSFGRIGSVHPASALGEANIRCFHNISTGNVTVFDHPVVSEERNFPVSLQYIYNSQAKDEKNGFKLSHKQFQALQTPPGTSETITLTEEDGYETTYFWSAVSGCYLPPFTETGRPSLRYEKTSNLWVWFHPDTRFTEYYDMSGRLVARADSLGRETTYEYKDPNPLLLTGIKTPGGNHYTIERTQYSAGNSAHSLYLTEPASTTPKRLRTWQFDKHGRLVKSSVLSPESFVYEIDYFWQDTGNLNQLRAVTQTDGSCLELVYEASANRLLKATLPGENEKDRAMSFEETARNIWQLTCDGGTSTLYTDEDKQLLKIATAPSFFNESQEETAFTWENARLESIEHPDGGMERFAWLAGESGQRLAHWFQEGREIHYGYDREHDNILVCETEISEEGTSFTRRNVYDFNMQCTGQTHGKGTALRFTISPEGRVTEYRYDAQGQTSSERIWLDNPFPVKPDATPESLEHMEAWTKTQDASRVSLTTFEYNDKGQVTKTLTFATVDSSGNGIQDERTGYTETTRNIHGTLVQEKNRQSQGYAPAITSISVDSLQRPITLTTPLSQTTSNTPDIPAGKNCTRQTSTHPDGRKDTVTTGIRGVLEERSEITQGGLLQSRITTLTYASNGCNTRIVSPTDGLTHYEFYDAMGKLQFSINQGGQVTRFHHDPILRYKTVTRYAKTIDTSTFAEGELSLEKLLSALTENHLPEDPDNREELTCLDLEGRIRFMVDANGALTETRYDRSANIIATIRYKTLLTPSDIERLKEEMTLNLPVNPQTDRCTCHFYDRDGLLVADQDEAGFVTEYKRNAAGWITETILYDTRVSINLDNHDFSKARPPANPAKDTHTWYFHNNRGLVDIMVNAEYQITGKTWLANGLVDKTRVYATRASQDFIDNPEKRPTLPAQSEEDLVTEHTYDLLDRNISTTQPNDNLQHIQYYNPKTDLPELEIQGDNTVFNIRNFNPKTGFARSDDYTTDVHTPNGDNYRATARRHDGLGRTIAKSDPMLSEKMAQIEADTTLAPEEKVRLLYLLWTRFSTRLVYNKDGLLIKTLISTADIYNQAAGSITPEMVKDTLCHLFYDAARRPVLRITVLNDVSVLIEETTYSAFDEIIEHRKYAQGLKIFPVTMIPTLAGGTIDSHLRKILDDLRQDSSDHVVSKSYDRTSRRITTIDGDGYPTHFAYNSFGECTEELQAVSSKKADLTLERDYDPRGLVTETRQKAPDILPVITRSEFNHPLGKCTLSISASGSETSFTYDRLGQELSHQTMVDNQTIEHTSEYDTFGRLTETNHAGEKSLNSWNRKTRTVEITQPDEQLKTTHRHNPFEEIVETVDALNNSELWTHTATGSERSYQRPSGAIRTVRHNLQGKCTETQDEQGIITRHQLDATGETLSTTKDAGDDTHLNLVTRYVRNNGLNLALAVIDPAKTVTEYAYNKKKAVTRKMIDPEGLQLLTTCSYNGQNQPVMETKGNLSTPNQYRRTLQYDGAGRHTGEIVDPGGLAIQKQQMLNIEGNSAALINPEGAVTWQIYNAIHQKRFEITPAGGVKEWRYTAAGHVEAAITYDALLNQETLQDITVKTTPAMLATKITADSKRDGAIYYFYDKAGRERFEISLLFDVKTGLYHGLVQETQYNQVSQPVKKIQYDQTIAGIDISSKGLLDIEQMVQKIASNKDSVIHQIYDENGQLRFCFDADNYVREIQYDASGKPILYINYATQISDAEKASLLPASQIASLLKRDEEKDQYHYRFLDALGRLAFEIQGEGSVTSYGYDLAGNRTTQCIYTQTLKIPAPYASLQEQLKTFKPDAKKDRINTKKFDAAGRCIQFIQADDATETYQPDALGNTIKRTDAMGAIWLSEFDRASREWKTSTPVVPVAEIMPTDTGILFYAGEESKAIIHQKTLNKNGEITEEILAAGTADERKVIFHHDSSGNLSGTEIPDVPVDNRTPFTTQGYRPETLQVVSTNIIYDARQKKIASRNEAGLWTFFIRDNLGRLCYTIKPEGITVRKVRDTKGLVIETTAFLTKWQTEQTTPPSLQEVDTWFKANTSPEDRTTRYQRDGRGHPVQIEKGLVYDYIPNIQRNGAPTPVTLSKMPAKKTLTFNAFGKVVSETTWLNSRDASVTITGFDRASNPVFQATAEGHPYEAVFWNIHLSTYNSFNERIEEYQYAKRLAQTVTADTPLSILKSWLASHKDAADRHLGWEYDSCGRETAALKYHVIRQELDVVPGKPATVRDVPLETLAMQRTQYNLSGLPVIKTMADGSAEYFYYDACHNLIARTGATQTNAGLTNPLTPLTFLEYNRHGQVVVKRRFKQGTTSVLSPDTHPTPLSTDSGDQKELTLYNKIGKPCIEQDAKGYPRATSWTVTGEKSREWQFITQWKRENTEPATFGVEVCIDSKTLEYNDSGLPVRQMVFRNNILQSIMNTDYNTFGQQQARWSKPEERNQDLVHYDTLGHPYRAMKNGVPTVLLHNFAGQEVWSAASPVPGKISALDYETLPEALNWSPTEAEVVQKGRDRKGLLRVISDPVRLVSGQTVTPVDEFEYDLWNNQTMHRDPLFNETHYTFNDADHCLSTELPAVNVVSAQGDTFGFRSKTTYAWNLKDQSIAESRNIEDGRTKTKACIRDATNPIIDILADGSIMQKQIWNPLGQRDVLVDSREFRWNAFYDLNGNLERQVSPGGGGYPQWLFDERNQISYMRNGERETWRYTWSAAGKPFESFQPSGMKTVRIYDSQGNIFQQINEDGTYVQSDRDFHGNLMRLLDLGYGETIYTRDGLNRVFSEKRKGGHISPWFDLVPTFPVVPYPPLEYKPQIHGMDSLPYNQHREYRYAFGQQISLEDCITGLRLDYVTDLAGRRENIRMINTQNGKVLREQEAKIDALGRETWLRDNTYYFYRGFTAESDIRCTHLACVAADGKQQTTTNWYDYNDINQVTVSGALINRKIVAIPNDGYTIEYEQGMRSAKTIPMMLASSAISEWKTKYSYDEIFRLKKVSATSWPPLNNPHALTYETGYQYDNADRVKYYEESAPTLYAVNHTFERNPDGNIGRDERIVSYNSAPKTSVATFKYDKNSGLLLAQTNIFAGGKGMDVTTYSYRKRNAYAVSRIDIVRTMEGYQPAYGAALINTGPNGEMNSMLGVISDRYYPSDSENRYITVAPDGNIIEKIILPSHTPLYGIRIISTLSGEPLGEVEYAISQSEAMKAWYSRNLPGLSSSIAEFRAPCRLYGAELNRKMPWALQPWSGGPPPEIIPDSEIYGAADNGAHMYVVDEQDSYESIAKKAYGDSEAAYLIGLVNGNQKLFPGLYLKIPYHVTSHYNASTTAPYHLFLSIMQGNISPYVPANMLLPQPHKKQSFLKKLIGLLTIAIAVILAIPSGGISLGFGLGAQLATIMGIAESSWAAIAAVTAAVAGLINASIQGVLAGFGVKEFSIAEAITAAFAAAGSAWLQASRVSGNAGLLLHASKATSVNIAEQLTLMSLGKQKQFDFLQASTAFLGAAMDTKLSKLTNTADIYSRTLVHSTANAMLNGAIRGKMDLGHMAVQMLSSSIMNIATPALMHGLEWADTNLFNNRVHNQISNAQQQAVRTAAKKQANANKNNVHQSEQRHLKPAMHPQDFMKKMGIDGLMEDYYKAKNGLVFEPEMDESFVPKINHNQPEASPESWSGSVNKNSATNLGPTVKASFWQTVDMVNAAGDGFTSSINHSMKATVEGGIGLIKGGYHFALNPVETTSDMIESAANLAANVKHIYHHPEIVKNQASASWKNYQNTSIVEKSRIVGSLGGNIASLFFGGSVSNGIIVSGSSAIQKGQGLAAKFTFKTNFSKELSSFRQARMLEKNTGYNISPESWFKYDEIGKYGTYITDYKAIGTILGPVRANTQFTAGFITRGNTVSYFKLAKLELSLGLESGSLSEGFRFTRVSNINQMHPRSPLIGNSFFNPGQGLPAGGPELIIDSIKTASWARR